MRNDKRIGSVVGIAILLFLAACSVQNNYSTLSLFFDGVPDPEEARQKAINDSLKAIAADSLALNIKSVTSEFLFHQPYLEKKCSNCHDKGRMGSLSKPMPELCSQCHQNFDQQFSFNHGPVAGGFCTECHDPHKSKEEKLLKRTSQDLCFHCHDTEQVYENDFHNIKDETDCIDCHNPHSGDNNFMLETESCNMCHESLVDKYKVIHGPVASGNCYQCHVSHKTGTEKLLLLSGHLLCFNCHNAGQILTGETHEGIEDSDCTDCHNPHGGEDRFMFN